MEIQFVDIFNIGPAQYAPTYRFLSWVWLKTFGCTDTVDMMFVDAASPTGENPPTHYFCARRISTITLEHYLSEMKDRSSKAFDWVYPVPTLDKDIALNNFVMMLLSQEDALNLLGLKAIPKGVS